MINADDALSVCLCQKPWPIRLGRVHTFCDLPQFGSPSGARPAHPEREFCVATFRHTQQGAGASCD
eukprot:6124719-Prymnesium_polylepis.1